MDIDHVHFYVGDARRSRNWFVHTLGFQPIAGWTTPDTATEVVNSGQVWIALSSPLTAASPAAAYLQQHPPGVVDVAFRVRDLTAVVAHAAENGVAILEPIQEQPDLRWAAIATGRSATIAGWGDLQHTLIEYAEAVPHSGFWQAPNDRWERVARTNPMPHFSGIDHVVLNVAAGELPIALAWYQQVLGFQPQRTFEIQTPHSGLCSQVLMHPEGTAQFPINEPVTTNSQIQEFLDYNCGSGIQHLALRTPDILEAIAQLRRSGLGFLEVPGSYYEQLQQRFQHFLKMQDWQAIVDHQVLVDGQEDVPEAVLLQTFTRPIFKEPTFFFELIERRQQAQGFGEGNFLALFEAIEREQLKRGSLV